MEQTYRNVLQTMQKNVEKTADVTADAVEWDTVNFSSEALARLNAPVGPVGNTETAFVPIQSFNVEDGSQFLIEAAKNPEGDMDDRVFVRVTITDADGKAVSFSLSSSSVIGRGEDGAWGVLQRETAQSQIQGTSGDDVIFLLSSGDGESGHVSVDAGDGDNIVVDFTKGHTDITSGKGNDKIYGLGGGSYTVASGDGDDIIDLVGDYARIDSGDGNDAIHIKNAIGVDIDSGDGNDTIMIDGETLYNSVISGGKGHDVITVNSDAVMTNISGDEGDDTIALQYAHFSSINGGGGNDAVSIKVAGHSRVNGDAGDDAITIGGTYCSEIAGGVNDDKITVTNAHYSTIFGDEGNDSITVHTIWRPSEITGGDGNDSISVDEISTIFGMQTPLSSAIDGGEGNDSITIGQIGVDLVCPVDSRTQIMGGGGNDVITVQKEAPGTDIDGGDGNDVIRAGHLLRSHLTGGNGNDTLIVDNSLHDIIDGGDGDDSIIIKNASRTEIIGGDGNDTFDIGLLSVSNLIGGDGNDNISVAYAEAGNIVGNQGDDNITVYVAGLNNKIFGDNVIRDNDVAFLYGGLPKTLAAMKGTGGAATGNDNIFVGVAQNARVDGGGGNDSITVGYAQNSVIGGGEGDDDINIGIARNSVIVGDTLPNMADVLLQTIPENSRDSSQNVTVADTPPKQQARENTNLSTERILSEEEIELEAMIRGDEAHYAVRRLRNRHTAVQYGRMPHQQKYDITATA
jgi:Ca2+-binding RTX toxin-like protein